MPSAPPPDPDLAKKISIIRDGLARAAKAAGANSEQRNAEEQRVLEERAAWEAQAVRAVADKVEKEVGTAGGENASQRHQEAKKRLENERADYTLEGYAAHFKRLAVETKRLEEDMALRREYASKAVNLAQGAVAFWFVMVIMSGVTNLARGKDFLSDAALIALTTGATVNVIAIFLVVVKGLFPPHVSSKPEETDPGKKGKSGPLG